MINGLNSYSNTNFIKTYASRMSPPTNNKQETNHFQNVPDSEMTQGKPVKASIFYMNDLHGQNIRMERLFNAIKQFDLQTSKDTDKMKFASGDIMLGEDEKHVKVADTFLNLAGVMASVIGNHECDMPTAQFANLINDKKYKLLGLNMNPSVNNPIKKYIEKSYVQEINGNKYGIIGLVPPDLADFVKLQEHLPDLHIEKDFNKTINEVQAEVDKFKKDGINKIIVLSHSGYRQDVKLAQSVKGIDIILGAHTHNLLEGIEKDKNLFYSPSDEPVIITQAGRDGKNFGVLNVEFDNNGVIKKVQNNLGKTDLYSRNLIARKQFEDILGNPEVVGSLGNVEKVPDDIYAHENPHCDFIMDAMRKELGTDIAMMNSGNIRGQFETGRVDTRDLAIISPFANKVVVVKVSEDEIVNAIKKRSKTTMQSRSHRPGLVQVSGLKYKINNSGDLLSLSFIDKHNKEIPIDVNNPSKDKLYTLATDDFCMLSEEGGLGISHRYPSALKVFNHDKDIVVAQHIKNNKEPLEVKSDGRIIVVDENGKEI